jgi:hypothetical protein
MAIVIEFLVRDDQNMKSDDTPSPDVDARTVRTDPETDREWPATT